MNFLYRILLLLGIASCKKVHVDPGVPVLGIDLGTTYSCVTASIDGRREVITNSQGNRITPSYVAFTPDGVRLIGDSAKNQLTTNPQNTIFDVKRIIGQRWKDESLQKEIKQFPFKVKEMDGRPYIQVTTSPGKTGYFTAEEVSAMVLSNQKEIAERHYSMNISYAVVTIPAYFSDAQRQATMDAAVIAGLDVLRIINEPTAAAIAYGLGNVDKKGKIVLVYDLGGGTLDVSLVEMSDDGYSVIATSGNTHLGGEDFERRVVDFFVKLFAKKYDIDLSKDDRGIQKLRREVERAKRVLSSITSTRVEVENIVPGKDFSEGLSRAKFEELNADLFKETLASIGKVFDHAGMGKEDVGELVLVGGSTRIPKIKQLVQDYLGIEASRGVNPDEAVSIGAAIYAGMLSGQDAEDTAVIVDVNPFTLGVEANGMKMSPLIPGQSSIPAKQKKEFTTSVDNQEVVAIRVFEGERPLTKDNRFLGQFDLNGIPPAQKGVPVIEVEFAINADGILVVSAQDKGTKKVNSITINNDHSRLTPGEIKRKIKEAKLYSEEDKKTEQKFKAKDELESLVYKAKDTIAVLGSGKLSYEEESTVEEASHQMEVWLADHPLEHASIYNEKLKEFEAIVHPIFNKLYVKEDGKGGRNSSRENDEL